jgi:TIR domain
MQGPSPCATGFRIAAGRTRSSSISIRSAAGERWERKLHEAANRCEAVLFLVSKAWLASVWCRKELNLAHSLNKRLFGVLIEELPVGAQGASASASAARP